MSKKEKGKYKFGDLIIKPTMQKLTKDKDYQVGDLTKSLLPNDVRKKVVGSDTAEDIVEKDRVQSDQRGRRYIDNLLLTFEREIDVLGSDVKKFANKVSELLVGGYVPTVDLSALTDPSQSLDSLEEELNTERHRLTAATKEMKDKLADVPASAKASKLYQKVFAKFSAVVKEFESASKKHLQHHRDHRDRAMSLSFPGEETAELQQVRMADEQASKIATMVLERNAQIQDAQADMLKLHEMFRDMQTLTAHQGEQIEIIEEHAIESEQNVERASAQLTKAEEYTNRYRRMMCYGAILLAVLSAAAAAVVYFFVLKPHDTPTPPAPAPTTSPPSLSLRKHLKQTGLLVD